MSRIARLSAFAALALIAAQAPPAMAKEYHHAPARSGSGIGSGYVGVPCANPQLAMACFRKEAPRVKLDPGYNPPTSKPNKGSGCGIDPRLLIACVEKPKA